MTKQVGFFLIFNLFVSSIASAQTCDKNFLSNCNPAQSNFNYTRHEASTAFKMTMGSTNQFAVTLKKGMDYRIFICSDAIFDDIVKLVLLNAKGKELYNNSLHNYQLKVEFSNKVTQEVVFSISTPEPNNVDSYRKQEGCVGLYIEQIKTPKVGF